MKPPDDRSRPAGNGAAPNTTSQVDAAQSKPRASRITQLRRRRAASRRMVPLDCGCPDPWPCDCTDPPLSEHAIDGYRDAALHLLDAGQMPLVPLEVRRALYRRGGADRMLAKLLHQACGGEAA